MTARTILILMLFSGGLSTGFGKYHAVLFNGTGISEPDKLIALTIAGIVNRDSARLYLLNVYETWSYNQTDEQWRDIYRSRGDVQFDSISGIVSLVERFRPFLAGVITYDPAKTYGNFPGQSFLWQGEYAALIGGLTSRIPATSAFASAMSLAIDDSVQVVDAFHADAVRWIPGKLESATHPWNNTALSSEEQYLTLLQWGVKVLLPLCNPSKFYIREISDFAIQNKMFQVNLAGNHDLKLDSLPTPKAVIVENILEYFHQQNPNTIFHIYGWIRPEPMTQWFAYFGASFHETLLGNLSWHSSFPVHDRTYVPRSLVDSDTMVVENKYYLMFVGSEGDASNWQFSFQSGAWLSPKRGSVPITWGWNLHLFEECPFVASYYYDTATPNDGFISVTSPLGYAYPDLWQNDVWNNAVAESDRLMTKFGIRSVYGYKHYEGNGIATYRGKTISNSFNFTKYGAFQKAIGSDLTLLFDPLLPLQTPLTQYGSILFNHCDDGSFYGNASNISTMATRILNSLKQKQPPYFLLAGYQRFRQDDFGVRIDPSAADMSVVRLEQLVSLMKFDPQIGDKIAVVTIDAFNALLRKYYAISAVSTAPSIPAAFVLDQNFPNPFNPSTTIRLYLPERTFVSLKVYDVLGREAADVVHKEIDGGTYSVRFSPTEFGLSGGVYFYRMRAKNFSMTRKMVFTE